MTDLFSAPTDTGSWKRHLAVLQQRLGPAEVDGWFQDARLVSHDEVTAKLAFPSQLHIEWIRKRHMKTLREVLGVERVELVVDEALNEAAASRPAPAAVTDPKGEGARAGKSAPAAGASAVPAHRVEGGDGARILNPDYTFDNYVVGAGNRFAHAAARGVADRPAVAFNPLFLHGSVGLGKTHLMQAVAHHLLDARQGLKIVFLSCEQFVNHFIGALQRGSLESFRQRYRQADVLVVDDIHLLANKARTQEEFFHTFNELHNARKQIVLSSDSPPEDIPSLQEQLVSRFKWGLVGEIQAPDFETRVAILQHKAEGQALELTEEVSQFIAQNVDNNVRELEGALTRVHALASLSGRPISLSLAREALGAEIRQRSRAVGIDDILAVVTRHFGVKVSDLQSKRRTQSIVFPRQVAMFLARRMTQLSLEEIGGYFGGRDHTTVIHAIERVEKRRQVDGDLGSILGELNHEVRAQIHRGRS